MNLKYVVFGGGNPGGGSGGGAGGSAGGTFFGGNSMGCGSKNIAGLVVPANVINSGPKTASGGKPF